MVNRPEITIKKARTITTGTVKWGELGQLV